MGSFHQVVSYFAGAYFYDVDTLVINEFLSALSAGRITQQVTHQKMVGNIALMFCNTFWKLAVKCMGMTIYLQSIQTHCR